MSCNHHSQAEFEAQQRFISEFMGRSKPNFPAGKISENDQGELTFALAADLKRGVVILRFGKPVDWLGLEPEYARNLAKMLIEKADQVEHGPAPQKP